MANNRNWNFTGFVRLKQILTNSVKTVGGERILGNTKFTRN